MEMFDGYVSPEYTSSKEKQYFNKNKELLYESNKSKPRTYSVRTGDFELRFIKDTNGQTHFSKVNIVEERAQMRDTIIDHCYNIYFN